MSIGKSDDDSILVEKTKNSPWPKWYCIVQLVKESSLFPSPINITTRSVWCVSSSALCSTTRYNKSVVELFLEL